MEMNHASRGQPPTAQMTPGQMMFHHYGKARWTQGVLMVLGVWTALAPWTFGYPDAAMRWNDAVCGILIVVLARLGWGRLGLKAGIANSLIGVWLIFAPLIFWAKSPAGYANDTLMGALVIALAVLVPMGHEMKGGDVPPGWTYNPSSWPQRAPIIALGLVGFVLSRYMAGYQLGYIDSAWDPFFGDGTRKVLDSEVSKMWPVSDAGLGAGTYLLEVLSGFMGDKRRWRTMPWMVAMFGFIVVPLGVVSIALIMMQPLAVGAWCTLCLISAAAMVVMIPLTLDEVFAMLQLLQRARREGKGVWRVFWHGDDQPEDEERASVRPISWAHRPMLWGVTSSWPLLLATAVGVWLMFAPSVFGLSIQLPAADNDHVVGATIIVVSVVALAEVARPLRFCNLALGTWLLVTPWFFSSATTPSRISDVVCGIIVIAASLPLGRIRDHYGRLDRIVTWPRAHRPLARAS